MPLTLQTNSINPCNFKSSGIIYYKPKRVYKSSITQCCGKCILGVVSLCHFCLSFIQPNTQGIRKLVQNKRKKYGKCLDSGMRLSGLSDDIVPAQINDENSAQFHGGTCSHSSQNWSDHPYNPRMDQIKLLKKESLAARLRSSTPNGKQFQST